MLESASHRVLLLLPFLVLLGACRRVAPTVPPPSCEQLNVGGSEQWTRDSLLWASFAKPPGLQPVQRQSIDAPAGLWQEGESRLEIFLVPGAHDALAEWLSEADLGSTRVCDLVIGGSEVRQVRFRSATASGTVSLWSVPHRGYRPLIYYSGSAIRGIAQGVRITESVSLAGDR